VPRPLLSATTKKGQCTKEAVEGGDLAEKVDELDMVEVELLDEVMLRQHVPPQNLQHHTVGHTYVMC